MLHYQTITQETLALLKQLTKLKGFEELRLVGGTALALHYGHRKSIDLDFFGTLKIDKYGLSEILEPLGKLQLLNETQNIHSYAINNIKVDIVNYNYPWITDSFEKDGLRLAPPEDIAAMKLAAINGRGTKKDFIDIFFLLQHFSLDEIIKCYEKKYKEGSAFLVLKSLTYFDDAEKDSAPEMLLKTDWQEVKSSILKAHANYMNH